MTAIVGPFAHPVICVVIVLSIASAASAQQTDLTVHAPPTLEPIARRVGRIELASLERSLTAAGLSVPPRISVTLIPRDDARDQRHTAVDRRPCIRHFARRHLP